MSTPPGFWTLFAELTLDTYPINITQEITFIPCAHHTAVYIGSEWNAGRNTQQTGNKTLYFRLLWTQFNCLNLNSIMKKAFSMGCKETDPRQWHAI